MSEFDVRIGNAKKITSIVFSDDEGETLSRLVSPDDESAEHLGMLTGTIAFVGNDDNAYILSQDDVENLIKALSKAVELKWIKPLDNDLIKNLGTVVAIRGGH